MSANDHAVRLYSSPWWGDRVRAICEAVYAREGAFGNLPLSDFERFVLDTCASEGRDGEAARRLCFESLTGLDQHYGTHEPSRTEACGAWKRAYNSTLPPWAGSKGNLRPLEARNILSDLVVERVLPSDSRISADADDYRCSVVRAEGQRLFQLSIYGNFSRGGYRTFWTAAVRTTDPGDAAFPIIVNAFLDQSYPAATLDEFAALCRKHAQKVGATAAYLDATATSS